MLDVAIIGSGPAGLSASIYVNRAGLSSVIFSGDNPGGLLMQTSDVDNYLGFNSITGPELAMKFMEHAESFGTSIEYETIEKIEKIHDYFKLYHTGGITEAKAVIYAAGATPKNLGLEKEYTPGVSYCGTCDGSFHKNEDVIVVGGGDTAVEDAIYLTNLAKTVTLLVRKDFLRAKATLSETLSKKENHKILYNTEIAEIIPNSDGKLEKVLLNTGETLPGTGLFIAIGQNPNSELVKDFVNTDQSGFILESFTPGLFIAGDVSDSKYRQAIIAAGDGARAALDAVEYLQ